MDIISLVCLSLSPVKTINSFWPITDKEDGGNNIGDQAKKYEGNISVLFGWNETQ